ncbi:MAG: hypothetical protein CMA02_03845 [Euryarchaeota archaeon]|nr:hypothetical protein [Euryarchaeota archaeon]
MIFVERSFNKKTTKSGLIKKKRTLRPFNNMNSVERETKIRELRESQRPDNFDAWVCLGGDYRDMAEVQEWAKEGEKEELLEQYSEFQVWMEKNPRE